MFVLNRLVDGYFLADMIINFNTAVFDAKSGCWITDRRVIAERYMENWFAIDVISILPYDVLSVSKSFNRFRLLRTLKVLKLLKLLRVVRIGRLLNWWASRLQLSFKSLSVLRFVFIIVVVLHWFACAARMLIRPCLEADAVTGVAGHVGQVVAERRVAEVRVDAGVRAEAARLGAALLRRDFLRGVADVALDGAALLAVLGDPVAVLAGVALGKGVGFGQRGRRAARGLKGGGAPSCTSCRRSRTWTRRPRTWRGRRRGRAGRAAWSALFSIRQATERSLSAEV
jgi:hypothetical protein